MAKLSGSLLSPENFDSVVADCSQLVFDEVAHKNIAIRSIFQLVRRAKPDLVERALKVLLPEFAVALDPVYTQFQAANETSFVEYVGNNRQEIADRLLQVTDRRIEAAQSKPIRGGYSKLRGRADREVRQALPKVAAVVGKYHTSRDNSL